MIYKRAGSFLSWYKKFSERVYVSFDIWIQWTDLLFQVGKNFWLMIDDWVFMFPRLSIFRYWLVSLLCLFCPCAFLLYIRVIVVWTCVFINIFIKSCIFVVHHGDCSTQSYGKRLGTYKRKYHFDKKFWSLGFGYISGWLEQQVRIF